MVVTPLWVTQFPLNNNCVGKLKQTWYIILDCSLLPPCLLWQSGPVHLFSCPASKTTFAQEGSSGPWHQTCYGWGARGYFGLFDNWGRSYFGGFNLLQILIYFLFEHSKHSFKCHANSKTFFYQITNTINHKQGWRTLPIIIFSSNVLKLYEMLT